MRSQRGHTHHWSWPRRGPVAFAPGHTGTHQRCYCGTSRIRGVKADPGRVVEEPAEEWTGNTLPVLRRAIRKRLIAQPRIAGGAGPFFWVGGTGTWDNATNTHWALSSGGVGGAGIPTAADNVTFDNSSGLTSNTVVTIAATAACNNLTIGSIAQASAAFTLSGNFTVSGAASVQGNSVTQRPIFNSSAVGTQRTLTFTTVSALANIDFMDIKGAGGLATFAGTSIGDAQGNATINLTAMRTLYWVATSGGSWGATTSWSLATGGASGQNPPLPQDDVNFDSNSITSAGHTITVNLVRSGHNITVTLAWATTWTYSTNWSGYGSLDFFASVSGGASLITFTSASTQTLRGRGNYGFNPPHQGSPVFSQGWQFIAPGGTYTIDTDWETSVSAATAIGFSVVSGAIAFGGVAVHFTTTSLNLSGAAASIDFTNLFQIVITGTQNTSAGYVWNAAGAASVTIGGANIILSDASANNKTFIGGAHTYYKFDVTTATANGYIFTGANHYGVFTLTAGLVMFSLTTHTFTNFIANNGAGGLLVQSQTGGSQATLAAEAGIGGFSWKGVTVQDITTSAALTIWVTSGVNTSNNGARVIFAAPSRSYAPTQSQSPTLIATDKRTFKPSGQSQTPTLKSTDKRTFVPTLSYFSQVLEEEPIAYWRLDESSGTTATDVQGTYPALYHGGFTLAQAGAVDGDDAVALDGTTGYLQVPVVAGLHPARFTYEAWIYPTVSSGVDKAIFASRASNRGILWWINGAVLAAYLYDGAAPHQFTNAAAIPVANAWYHVALTYDGAVATMYVNGVALANTMAMATYVPQTTTVLIIGRDAPSAEFYFPGTMDEAAIYNYALSAAEISDHYQAGLGNLTGQTQTPQAVANPNRAFKPTGQSQAVSMTASDSRAFKPTQSQSVSFKEPVSRAFTPTGQSQTPTLTSADARTLKPSGQSQTGKLVSTDSRIFKPTQSQATTTQASDTRIFKPTQSQGVALQGSDARTFKVTQSQSAVIVRILARPFTLAQSGSVALVRMAARIFKPTQSQGTSFGARAVTRSLAPAGQAQTPSLGVRTVTRLLTSTQSQAVALTRTMARALAAAKGQAPGYSRAIGRAFTATQAGAAKLQRLVVRASTLTQPGTATLQQLVTRASALAQAGAVALGRAPSRAFTRTQAANATRGVSTFGNIATSQLGSASLAGTAARSLAGSQSQACYTVRGSTVALAATQAQLVEREIEVGRRVTLTSDQRVKLIIPLPPGTIELTQDQAVQLAVEPQPVRAATQGQASVLAGTPQRTFEAPQSANPLLIRMIRNVLAGTQPQTAAVTRARPAILALAQLQARTRLAALARRAAVGQAAGARLLRVVLGHRSVTAGQSASHSTRRATALNLQQTQTTAFDASLHRVRATTQTQRATTRREIATIRILHQHQGILAGKLGKGYLVVVIRTDALTGTTTPFSDLGVGTATARLDVDTPRRELVGTTSGRGGVVTAAVRDGMLAEVSSAALRSETSTDQLAASVEKRELEVTTRRKRL